MSESAPAQGAQTVDRALQLLELLGPGPHVAGLTVTQLAGELGVGRPVVYRLVRSLEARGFVRRFSDGRYRLGPMVHRLAAAVEDELAAVATPILSKLADELGATAHLTVAHGAEAVAVAVVEPSWTSMHVTYRVGSRHLLERGAAGRAILGGRAGERAPVSSHGELQSGAFGVAAPVLGLSGIEASIGVIALSPFEGEQASAPVLAAAAAFAEAHESFGQRPG